MLINIKNIFIFFIVSFLMANPIPMNSAINFKLNTNDINKNGKNDVLCFEGKTIVKKVEIYDIENKNINSIWSYSLPKNFIGYFTDAEIVSFDNKNYKLILIASLKNNENIFFFFDIINGKIDTLPSNLLSLPEKYSHLKNPHQITLIDWDNDQDDEVAISFSGAFRSILICDFLNNQILVIDNIAEDFLSTTFSPILIGSGDLNGDHKQDIIVVDNGRKANARIFLNRKRKDGLRVLGLKDIGQLSFLSKTSVNFNESGGDEIFFASKQFGLHYLFVESIGRVNQAVTVKTELLIDTINKIFIADSPLSNQIVTIDPNGALGRYEIINKNDNLSVGVFENKKINFSVMRPNEISSIYFPIKKQLIVSAYNDIQSELYFYNHTSFIEPAINYSLQRKDKRLPDIIINVNDSTKIDLPWIDSLQFYEFKSTSLLDGMNFITKNKSLSWSPNINNLGFNEIFFDLSFKNQGSFNSISDDTLTQVVFNQDLLIKKDSILIYVNDKPSLQNNKNIFNVIGGADFKQKFVSVDRNIDSKLTFYFLNDILDGVSVDDSGIVSWKIPEKIVGKRQFDLCVDDSINKDSIQLIFNIHPKIDFSLKDTIYIASLGNVFSLSFSPDTAYSFNSYQYFLPDAPKNMHINNEGSFYWEPNPSQIDLNKFTVLITDGTTESKQAVSIYVNSKPIISSSPPEILHISQNDNFGFRFDSFDANSDASLDWALISGPKGMVMESNGMATWIPDNLDFIEYTISLSDGYDLSKYNGSLYINSSPKITSSSKTMINLGDTLFYKVITEDLNAKLFNNKSKANVFSYKIIKAPSKSEFNNNILSWVPDDDFVGNNEFSISVSDGLENDIQTFTLFVNDIPEIFNSDTIFTEINKTLNHKILIKDLNINDVIDIDIINNDLGILLNGDTLNWLPDTSFLGNNLINLRINDGRISFNNNFELIINVFSKPIFQNRPSNDAYVGIEYIYKPNVSFFNNKNSKIELLESSSSAITFINNQIKWIPTIEDAKKEIHKVTLKATTIKKRETFMEFFIKVYENPKISN